MKTMWLLTVVLALASGSGTPGEMNRRALELLDQGEYDQAVALLAQAVQASEDPVIHRNLAVARNNRGLSHLREARCDRAIIDFDAAARLVEDDPLFQVHLGYAYLLARDLPRAEAVLLRARSRFPEEPRVYDFLGFLYYSRDELEQAINAYERRLELEPDRWAQDQLERSRREHAVSADYVDRSSNDFTLKFLGSAGNYKVASEILGILDRARARVGSDLGHFPNERTTVLLYSDADFRKATGANGWVGGLYDGKIRLPVSNFERNRESVARTARHEYTHRVIADIAPNCPIWVNEGIAEWFEDDGLNAHRDIRDQVGLGNAVPSFAAMPKSFASQKNASLVKIQYAASRSFMAFLRQRYGLGALRSLLEALGRGDELDLAMKRNFGGSLDQLEALWRREILR